jgi:tetratricopeptide (TPR) repeat protein
MSIIHDALKKAEREPQSIPLMLSLYQRQTAVGRRWRAWVLVSVSLGGMLLGSAAAWTWLQAPGALSTAAVAESTLASRPPLPVVETSGEPPGFKSLVGTAAQETAAPTRSPGSTSEAAVEALKDVSAALASAREAEIDGQREVAIALYRQAIALNPELAEARNSLGKLLVYQGDIAAAIEEFEAALAVKTDYALARNNLGSAYLLNGQEDQAIREFLTALRLDHAYVSPYYNLALLHARRRDFERASAFLTKALALEPEVWSWIDENPEFAELRSAPEFQRFRSHRQVHR